MSVLCLIFIIKKHNKFTYKIIVMWNDILSLLCWRYTLFLLISYIPFWKTTMDDMNHFLFFASRVTFSFDDCFIIRVSLEEKIIIQNMYKHNLIDLQPLQSLNPNYEKKVLHWGVDEDEDKEDEHKDDKLKCSQHDRKVWKSQYWSMDTNWRVVVAMIHVFERKRNEIYLISFTSYSVIIF